MSEPLMEMIFMIYMIEIKGRGLRNRGTGGGSGGEWRGNNYYNRLKTTGI